MVPKESEGDSLLNGCNSFEMKIGLILKVSMLIVRLDDPQIYLYLTRQLFLVRSLAACELLYNAGYENLFWVQGGLESAQDEVIQLF